MRVHRNVPVAAVAVFVVCAIVFWRTAYPSITWWDSSGYSLAAATLGIYSPPGSLLLTLLGWPVAHLPFVTSPAHALNLFAGILASIAAASVCVVALDLLGAAGIEARPSRVPALAAGASAGALTFAFAGALWVYAVQFTPYVLSVAVTGVIWWTLVRWWQRADAPDAWRWIALLGLLFGLDFSVHRTNALLIPGAIAWILIRKPSVLRDIRTLAAGAGALVVGLSAQLLLIPIARHTVSPLDWTHPDTLSRFWDYVSLKQLGGSFLLNLIPRKSPLLSAQTMDLVRVLGANFFSTSGRLGVLGVVPGLAAVTGLAALWRANRRIAAAFATALVLQAAFTVFYFNIPAGFFRTFDRHYLPVCLTIAVLVACGLAVAADWVVSAFRVPALTARLAPVAALALVATMPVAELARNWRVNDASSRWFTHDYAENALRSLPPNAIYFTVGDNDTFPVMYLQSAEGVRPDVTIANLSIANVPEWPELERRRDPALPVSLPAGTRDALAKHPWKDTTVVVPVNGTASDFGLRSDTTLPASISLDVKPRDGDRMIPAEVVLLDMVRTNAWKRPLAFALTGTKNAMEWLAPYGRLDGLFYRVTPVRNAAPDTALLRVALLQNSKYRGYADSTVIVDEVARMMGGLPYPGIISLLETEAVAGGLNRCRADRKAFYALVPPERIALPDGVRESIDHACADGPPQGTAASKNKGR